MTLNSIHIAGVTQISLKLSHSEDKDSEVVCIRIPSSYSLLS